MKPGLSVRVGQQLALTPQLQQTLRLLQLSTPDLLQEVEQALADNPFLEADEGVFPDAADGVPAADVDAERDGAEDDFAAAGDAPAADPEAASDGSEDQSLDFDAVDTGGADEGWEASAAASDAAGDDPMDYQEAEETLAHHLHFQANLLRLEPEDAAALHFLIDALDSDGFLEDSLAELASALVEEADGMEAMQELVQRLRRALECLQTLDPSGVGARDLVECLTLQLRARRAEAAGDMQQQVVVDTALALCALEDATALLAGRDAGRLARLIGASAAAVGAALELIGRLEPRPGRDFAVLTGQIVIPEIIVSPSRADPARWTVELNPAAVPALSVHELYASSLKPRAGAAHAQLRRHLSDARGFVKGLHFRHDTVLRVARCIVAHQSGFFERGAVALRPLAQRALAAELQLHESTVSRATAGKYMATPRGTYELKYFFGGSVGPGEHGEAISGAATRAHIAQLVAAEDARTPLSDAQLVQRLKAHGITCARRTVAKYREALQIPTASARRNRGAA